MKKRVRIADAQQERSAVTQAKCGSLLTTGGRFPRCRCRQILSAFIVVTSAMVTPVGPKKPIISIERK